MAQRKYKDGDYVLIGYPFPHLRVKIETAELCVKGWKYKLRYLRKDNKTVDKRKEGIWHFEDKLTPWTE